MSDLNEVKTLFSETQKTVEAMRADLEGLKGKTKDVIDADRLAKMEAEIAEKFSAEQKAMADRIEAVETASARGFAPNTTSAADDAKHKSMFIDYLRKGSQADELKAMQTNVQAEGGYAVPDGMAAGIQKRYRRSSPIRAVANVVQFSGGTYSVLVERDDAGYEWAGETQSRSETSTPTINKIDIATHELSAKPKISQRMLDVADFDVEGWLTGYVANRFERGEATAFIAGDGVMKPKGFLSYGKAATADDARGVETLQFRITGADGAFATSGPADVLTQTFYDLQGEYQANASWMMKNTTAAVVATLKDGDGAYLLQSMLNTDGAIVRTIQGRPMFVADDMPAIGSNSFSIAVGDFGAGYTIVDDKAITVLRDPYSSKPNVLFYTTKRVGGGVTDFDAIKLIKFGTA